MRLLACLIVAPRWGYDEPKILSYAISPFCPTSADGLQPRASSIRPRSCVRLCKTPLAGLLITTEAMVAEKPKKDAGMPAMPGGGMGGMGGMDY
jgi:hypothetical protein